MSKKQLSDAICAVDWNGNVSAFLKNDPVVEALAKPNMRIAIWANQFEAVDVGNPALSYIREMQIAGQHVIALAAIALYRPAAASMRNMVEAALYYTYFRTHPSELSTLVRESSYYIDKRDVVDFHKRHTPQFNMMQDKLGLLSRLEMWYSATSAIVHGRIPGAWVNHSALKNVAYSDETLQLVVSKFSEAEDIIYKLFLCTAGKYFWDNFNSPAKISLLKGLSGEFKALIGLDEA